MPKPENPALFDTNIDGEAYSHITLRDLFAGMAMQGMLANGAVALSNAEMARPNYLSLITKRSFEYADAMLAARESGRE